MGKNVLKINLTERQEKLLSQIATSRTSESRHCQRSGIILDFYHGLSKSQIKLKFGIDARTVVHWVEKWMEWEESLQALEAEESKRKYELSILTILSDNARPGTPTKFTAEQICRIIALSCENPQDSGYPVSSWSLPLLVQEAKERQVVESISRSQMHRFLK